MNKPLWVDYQNGADYLITIAARAFSRWAERINVAPGLLNDAFISAMAEICSPLPGAALATFNATAGRLKSVYY